MSELSIGAGLALVGAGLAVLGGALGTGLAQMSIGSAAMGVIAEKPEEGGKLLVWLVIPETIVIFGFVIGLLLALQVAG